MDNFLDLKNSSFLQTEFFGNSLFEWILFLVLFFVVVGVLRLLRSVLAAKSRKLSEKSADGLGALMIGALGRIRWPFFVIAALYFSLQTLDVPDFLTRWLFYLVVIAAGYYAIRFIEQFIDFGARLAVNRRVREESDAGVIKILASVAKIAVWVFALLMILSNLGYNVTSVMAGLGIGGIAVALAIQNILGDLFNSLAIYFDKPFKNGDFIVVGEYMGIVKKVGIKTTRIQALQGEEIVFSNSDLMGARIQNFGVMQRRRIVFTIGVTYGTPPEKLKRIPDMIRAIITNQEQAEPDRIHFKAFGDSNLIFEIVYYVATGDYNTYMNIQQSINLKIMEEFAAEKIEFAFPTQTIHVHKDK